ncbi:unnamed protein product, partial [marine sediment metagenome]
MPIVFKRSYNNQAAFDGPMGHKWDFSYNMRAKIEGDGDTVTIYSGNRWKRVYLKSGSDYVAPTGYHDTLTRLYDDTAGDTFYYLTDKHGTEDKFDSAGCMLSITDRKGNGLSFEYNATDHLIKITDDFDREVALSYNENGRLSSITDWDNNTTSYTYDQTDTGKLTTVTYPESRDIEYGYDNDYNITSITDPKDNVYLTNRYDGSDRVDSQTYGSASCTFVYDPGNSKTTYTDYEGNLIEVIYNEAGYTLTKVVYLDATTSCTTTYGYNSDNDCIQIVYPESNSVEYSYDSKGSVI